MLLSISQRLNALTVIHPLRLIFPTISEKTSQTNSCIIENESCSSADLEMIAKLESRFTEVYFSDVDKISETIKITLPARKNNNYITVKRPSKKVSHIQKLHQQNFSRTPQLLML